MKCAKCGRKIGVEDKVCPYCNSVNELAAQHEKNMERYERKFKKTQGEAVGSVKRMEGLRVRLEILAILMVGMLIMGFIIAVNYADPDTDKEIEADSRKHSTEYAAEMDRYLEQGDYQSFYAFVHCHNISFWEEDYKKFRSVNYCTYDYYECICHMESVILRSTDSSYYDSTDLNISHFCMYLCEFRDTYAAQKESEKNSVYLACMDDMHQNLRALLRCYLGLSDDEVDEFWDLSDAKMAVRMEEVLKNE